MPANYIELIQDLPEHARVSAELLASRRDSCEADRALFFSPDLDLQAINQKIDEALRKLPALYLARPFREPFHTIVAAPAPPSSYSLLGIDGSQIVPSRHQAVPFGLINVGWIGVDHGSGRVPWTGKRSHIIPFAAMFNHYGSLISDTEVDLQRDLAERTLIPQLFAGESQGLRIALSDGSLEVHRSREDMHAAPRIEEQLARLETLFAQKQILHAGYIDKPGSAMLSRMLAIGQLKDINPESVSAAMRSLPTTDLELFQEHLKRPGERSAVFEIISKRPRGGSSELPQRVFCFYICLGQDELDGSPILARVEFAHWIAQQSALIAALHAVVFADTQVTPLHPFPYVLTRAHEEAVIGRNEAAAIEKMLAQAWRDAGMEHGSISAKAFGKEKLGG
jgi:hypothetical protein